MSNFWIKWGLPLTVFLLLTGGGVAFVLNQKQSDETLCRAVNDNRATLRNLLVSARNQTPKSRKKAQRFFRRQLKNVTPLDCGNFNRDSLERQQTKREHAARRGGDAPPGTTKQPP